MRAVAYCHSRRVAHGSLDGFAFLVDGYDVREAVASGGPRVRCANFGLSTVGVVDNGDELADAARAR